MSELADVYMQQPSEDRPRGRGKPFRGADTIASMRELYRNGSLGRILTQAQQTPWMRFVGAASIASTIALGVHGYRRNGGSVGWTLGWMALGTFLWPIGWAFALGQGFGKPKAMTPLAGLRRRSPNSFRFKPRSQPRRRARRR